MPGESGTEQTISISLPADLDDWLDEQAARADVEREQLLVELLTAFQHAVEADEVIAADLFDLDDEIADAVDAQLDDRLDAQIQQTVENRVADQVSEANNTLQRQLSSRLEQTEAEFEEKLADVRERVIQVKKETDAKAPQDHIHPELTQVETLENRISTLESELDAFRTEFDRLMADPDDGVSERVERIEQRLQTLAWVVRDLRETEQSHRGLEAVERIKRAAAKANIERANCENCSETVTISLLTDPECPHCQTTVTDVEPASGWFGKPKLLTAAQLEPGEVR